MHVDSALIPVFEAPLCDLTHTELELSKPEGLQQIVEPRTPVNFQLYSGRLVRPFKAKLSSTSDVWLA